MVGPMFEAVLAGESEMKISPVGEVSEIKVAEELTKVFEEMEERGPNQFAFLLGISMSEDGIKDELRRSVALLPGDPVADDTEWTQELESSQGPLGTLKMSFKYSYDGETEHEGTSYEKIDLDVQISFEIPEDSDAEVEISEQHNDIIAENIVVQDRLMLLDWEYACDNHPLFDLASVIGFHDLGAKQTDTLLSAYAGGADAILREHLDDQIRLYDSVQWLWLAARNSVTPNSRLTKRMEQLQQRIEE